jgi:hypothetical protein
VEEILVGVFIVFGLLVPLMSAFTLLVIALTET